MGRTIGKKPAALILTFTPRERKVYDYLLDGFEKAVDDLKYLSKLDKLSPAYETRMTRIDDRISNFAFTAREFGLDFNYERENDFEIHVTLW